MQVRQENEECEIECEFLRDCWDSLYIKLVQHKFGWPDRRQLAASLQEWPGKRNVHFQDLLMTGLFTSRPGLSAVRSSINFLEHYHRFDFLRAKPVGDYLPTMAHVEDDQRFELLQRSIFRAAGKPIPTLKEEGILAEHRRQDRLRQRNHAAERRGNGKYLEEADKVMLRRPGRDAQMLQGAHKPPSSSSDKQSFAADEHMVETLRWVSWSLKYACTSHKNGDGDAWMECDRDNSPAPTTPPDTPVFGALSCQPHAMRRVGVGST